MRNELFIDGQWAKPIKGGTFPIINPATEEVVHHGPAGTAEDVELAVKAARRAFDRIEELNHIMSDYLATSELARLSRNSGGPPVKVSEDLFRVLAESQNIARRSDGAFDITVGPIVKLWRRARRRHALPDHESIANALEKVGYENLVLNPRGRTAHLMKPGMELDLGAVGKGYADDEVLKVLAGF